jgi:hypothetical protein
MRAMVVGKIGSNRGAGMKVLLLHPEDDFEKLRAKTWDLIIDLGRAPAATYQRWKQQAACDVCSLHDLANEIEDLYRARQLLHSGFGAMVDRYSIDWWDVLLAELVPGILLLMLVERQARNLGSDCELYTTRPSFVASALAARMGVELKSVGAGLWKRSLLHYSRLLTHLDSGQLAQVFEDKFRTHRFASHVSAVQGPVILLPSAYLNGSRTAVWLAEQMLEHDFLLMYTRSSGKLPSVPPNVRISPLRGDPVQTDPSEMPELLARWEILKANLAADVEGCAFASSVGAFDQVPSLLRNGLSTRDAWMRVFDSTNVTGLICTDDSNPPTRIPLLLAKIQRLPTAVCHHGALDYMMALKSFCADSYIAKSSLERDYLQRVCHVPGKKIVDMAGRYSDLFRGTREPSADSDWLVFFSEPYEDKYWRTEEIYGELIPRLTSLAKTMGMRLVFKIHPFESVKAHRRRLRRLAGDEATQIEIIAGPPSGLLFQKTRLAITVQSTTALECARRGIPVFLCAWLRDAYSGYVEQFARFGVGHSLTSAAQITKIPKLLELARSGRTMYAKERQSTDWSKTLFSTRESSEAAPVG